MKRFKKLLPIAVTLALVAALLVPATAVLAAAVGTISDTLTDYTKSASYPKHTIVFTTTAELEVDDEITITFPDEFVISSIEDADVAETLTAGAATWAISGQDLVGTIITSTVTAGAQTVVIGDGAAAGLNDIPNPSVAGTYTISIVTTGDTEGTCDVNITETDTTAVTGNLPDVIEVSAPAGFTMPSLDPSAGTITSPVKNVNVSANGLSTWKLEAHEADGDGKMTCSVPGAGTLADVMEITTTGGVANVELSGSPATLWAAHTAGSDATVPVYFIQDVAYTDTVGSDYSITVTFTVGFNV